MLTLPESALALAALIALCQGHREALGLLRRLLKRVKPLPLGSVRASERVTRVAELPPPTAPDG